MVAGLLHYLFLCVFCWMLAEGIMLYLLVVRVFGTIASRWYYLLILGWGKMSDLIECYTLNTSMHAWLIYSWTLMMNMYSAGYYHLSIFGHDNYYTSTGSKENVNLFPQGSIVGSLGCL